MNRSKGKWHEAKLQTALDEWCGVNKAFFHRFADSHAARNLIPAQPADWLWAIPGFVMLVEAKSTETAEPLKKLLKGDQIGRHRLWHRAGHPSIFVYADKVNDVLQAWDGMEVIDLHLGTVRSKWSEEFYIGSLADYDELLEEAASYVKANY